jgi:GxxExxY protein
MTCLQFELAARRVRFVAQQSVPYKGITLDPTYRVDLIVEDQVVIEVKSVERLLAVHEAQVLTYMRLTGRPAGLLMNFNVPKLGRWGQAVGESQGKRAPSWNGGVNGEGGGNGITTEERRHGDERRPF